MMSFRRSHILGGVVALGAVTSSLAACGGPGETELTSGGAAPGSGGSSVASGGSLTGSGGTSSTFGGASSLGGSTSWGGATGTGGSSFASGGASTTSGGSTSSGGSASGGSGTTGGATSAGGRTSTGGSTATGGSGAGGSPPSNCVEGQSDCFSFFVASRARMFKAAEAFNGSTKGWGGDFRYGTADGLTGADKLCTEIAEQSLPGNGKTWRAFLSTSKVNAIDRVGKGPWYDRLNRIIANNTTELVATRPGGIKNSMILNNLPNEDGTPHHNEETGCTNLNSCADNHDVLTGSDSDGKFCTSTSCASFGGIGMGGGGMGGMGFPGGGGTTITDFSCKDWTLGTSMSGIAPRVGHTWPTQNGRQDDWISHLTENGCSPGFNLVQNGGPMPNGNGSVGDGGGYGGIYCLAARP